MERLINRKVYILFPMKYYYLVSRKQDYNEKGERKRSVRKKTVFPNRAEVIYEPTNHIWASFAI
jgi:hypothetical protein